MKIASIQARAVDMGFQSQKLQTTRVASPMSRFAQFGEKRSSWMWPTKKVFVRVESTDGAVGWSVTNGGEIVEMIVNQHLARLMQGAAISDLSDLWDQMFFSLLPCDRSGFPMMAIAGIDIALWDMRCRIEGRALADILGGGAGDLPVYCTTPQPEVHGDAGWWGLKAAMPFGTASGDHGLAANVDYIRQFRDVAGPDGRVMLDSFMAWDADYTLRFAERAADIGLTWIEDPLPPYDLEGLRLVRARAGDSIRLALGNFCFTRWDCAELTREGLVDVLQPDVAWAGGITECIRILDMARDAGVPVILHNTCEQPWALALAAARQTDAVVEYVDRGATSPLYELSGPPPVITRGRVQVPLAANRPPDPIRLMFHGETDAHRLTRS